MIDISRIMKVPWSTIWKIFIKPSDSPSKLMIKNLLFFFFFSHYPPLSSDSRVTKAPISLRETGVRTLRIFFSWFCSYKKFQDMCTSTALTECDFSSLSKYGDHTLRVRAELAEEHSDWVNITFSPVDDSESPYFPFPCHVTITLWVFTPLVGLSTAFL